MSDAAATVPAVSVIIPAYNAEEYIEACVKSVFAQTCADYELIIVNDGSSDDTPLILSRYADDKRARVINQPNAGTSAARNRGMDAARGEYVCFADADDALEPDYISAMLARARQTRADVISSGYTLWNGENMAGAYPAKKWDVQLGGETVSLMCVPFTRLYRAEFLRAHNIRFAPGERFEDVAFSLLVNLLARRIESIPENNYRYYARPRSYTARLRRGGISASDLPIRALTSAIAYLAARAEHDTLEFCVVKILAGVLFQNLRNNPVDVVDAFSAFCARVMGEYFPNAAKNPYISLFAPKSLPFIQRAAMMTFARARAPRTLRVIARAVTRL